MTNSKTHWLQNPNKNYLGHPDLPNGEDVVLTIKTAQWEEVKNPIINTSDAKRVVRFVENYPWLKPFICNEVNAEMVFKCTGEKFMEDCFGKKIKIGISKTMVKRVNVDCLRVRDVSQDKLSSAEIITIEEHKVLLELCDKAKKNIIDICAVYKIKKLNDLPATKLAQVQKRLIEIINENENN